MKVSVKSVRGAIILILLACHLGNPSLGVVAQVESDQSSVVIDGIAPQTLLSRMGARMEEGRFGLRVREYRTHFDRLDLDRDGRHSRSEFIDRGVYLNPTARQGIFNAADRNRDGWVTRAEYLLNRIITDESKAIMQAMDDDKDGKIQQKEFSGHALPLLNDSSLVGKLFSAFDTDGDGELLVPEYLRVWRYWARADGRTAKSRLSSLSLEGLRSLESEDLKSPGLGNEPNPGAVNGFSPDRLFRFDRNRDGKVSRSELPPFFRDRALERLDADGDDHITRAEASRLNR